MYSSDVSKDEGTTKNEGRRVSSHTCEINAYSVARILILYIYRKEFGDT